MENCLLNKTLKILDKKPVKKGNYLQEVRLFNADSKITGAELAKWVDNDFDAPKVKEIEEW